MSITIGHTSKNNGTAVTGLNLTHDCTGDDTLLANIVTRGNVTNMTATYNGDAMTLAAGPLTCTAGEYAQQWVFKLSNPDTGSNTLAFSWTTAANVGAMAVSYIGVVSIGTVTQATGNLNYTQSVTSNDMVVGFIGSPNTEAVITTYTGQTLDVVSSYTNQTGGSMNHATGTGSVTVDYTISSSTESVGAGVVLTGSSFHFSPFPSHYNT